ncbi:MAG: SatD family protein [Candidatus Cyclonatronum sp.]|uniref:SatD family protein n=1 Tax=Cyclonatronum sp. TaxID=3024185 RepID=UPI0025BA7737|nr:SatD family protein [Cyclonatronum sp.]MCH8486576.1 SatD family protein [Cyclonatronum sp.]
MTSKKETAFILMGDVSASRELDAAKLQTALRELVEKTNEQFKPETPSPYTITLGDEFQGVTQSLHSGIRTIFYMEENRLLLPVPFRLHYVLHQGFIETAINPDKAWGMMGEGLTRARELLTDKGRNRRRYTISLPTEAAPHAAQLNRNFAVLDGIISRWNPDDYELIFDMIQNESDAEVGKLHGKDRTQIYRRRKTLMINEYNLLKQAVFAGLEFMEAAL